MADPQTPSVAPSDALLSLVLARTADLVAARVDVDPVRIEEDAVTRLVADYADVDSTHGAALVEAVARRVGNDIGAADVAEHIDLSDIAGELDLSDLVGHIDLDEVASNFDASDLASHIDLSSLAGEVDLSDLAGYVARDIAAEDVASHIDVSDLATHIDAYEVAGHVDVDLDALAERIDLSDLADRVRRDIEMDNDLSDRVAGLEEVTGPIATMDAAIDLHRSRLVEVEERLARIEATAPSAADPVAVQVGPALPGSAPSGDVLALVVDRTVASLLAALNAAAAEGRL